MIVYIVFSSLEIFFFSFYMEKKCCGFVFQPSTILSSWSLSFPFYSSPIHLIYLSVFHHHFPSFPFLHLFFNSFILFPYTSLCCFSNVISFWCPSWSTFYSIILKGIYSPWQITSSHTWKWGRSLERSISCLSSSSKYWSKGRRKELYFLSKNKLPKRLGEDAHACGFNLFLWMAYHIAITCFWWFYLCSFPGAKRTNEIILIV